MLGVSGIEVSNIGLGTLHYGIYLDESQSINQVHYALDNGINFIDTAPLYGNGSSETILGKALKGKREQAIVTTKFGLKSSCNNNKFSVDVCSLTDAYIKESLNNSLKALKTDYVDLFMVHAFDQSVPQEEILSTLSKLKDDGKVRAIGCSNYSPEEIDLTIKVKNRNRNRVASLEAAQVHYNMLERKAEKAFLEKCNNNNIAVICNRALYRGLLTGKYKNGMELPEKSRANDSVRIRNLLNDKILLLVKELEEYCLLHDKSVSELAIAWLLKKRFVTTVLIGARNKIQLANCIKARDWNLTAETVNQVEKIISRYFSEENLYSNPNVFFER